MKNYRFYKAIEEHEKWVLSDKKDGIQLFLKNEDLSFLELNNKNLTEAIFENCNLQRVVIEDTIFDKAIIKNCNFSYGLFKNNKIKNSFFISNDFSGVHFYSNIFDENMFQGNIFNKSILEKEKINHSNFNENKYKNATLLDVIYNNSFFIKEKIVKVKYKNVKIVESYIDAKITQSYFFDSTLSNTYSMVQEEQTFFINTSPKNLFDSKKNIYNNLYREDLIDKIYKKIFVLENNILNIKIDKYIENIEFTIGNYRLQILNLFSELDKYEYLYSIIKHVSTNTQESNFIENKFIKMKQLLTEKLELVKILETQGDNDE